MRKTILIERLLFIYNADSGVFSAAADSAKKLLGIHGCALCSLTHSVIGERSEWRSCRETLGVPVAYFHRDELTPEIRRSVGEALPVVAAQVAGETIVLLDSHAIDRCNGSIADLRGRLRIHAVMR